MKNIKKTKVSPSSLSVLKDCPKCFYLMMNHGISRPRGIMASLMNGFDRIIKLHYDFHRKQGTLPDEIKSLSGTLFKDTDRLEGYRNKFKGLISEVSFLTVKGVLDELFIEADGKASVMDYKTKGKPPDQEGAERYYGHQVDIYAFLLSQNGFEVSGKGYLVYYSPLSILGKTELGVKTVMQADVITLEAKPERAVEFIERAAKVIAGPMPEPGEDCEYCAHYSALDAFHNLKRSAGLVNA